MPGSSALPPVARQVQGHPPELAVCSNGVQGQGGAGAADGQEGVLFGSDGILSRGTAHATEEPANPYRSPSRCPTRPGHRPRSLRMDNPGVVSQLLLRILFAVMFAALGMSVGTAVGVLVVVVVGLFHDFGFLEGFGLSMEITLLCAAVGAVAGLLVDPRGGSSRRRRRRGERGPANQPAPPRP